MDNYERAFRLQTRVLEQITRERNHYKKKVRETRFIAYGAVCGAIIGGMICAYIK